MGISKVVILDNLRPCCFGRSGGGEPRVFLVVAAPPPPSHSGATAFVF